ncbi:MAG: DUF1573 domain-containing protein [Limisphaerales bacterium]
MKTKLCRTIVLMTLGLTSGGLCFAAEPAAPAATPSAPKIKFETNFFDFGKVTSSEKLIGSFKFKNLGTAELKLDSPQASCDCTEAKISPDKLAPGAEGKVTYSIKMDHAVSGQRYIKVHSNDPENPDLELTIQLDYTPLFETTPPKLNVLLRPGKADVQTTFDVNRMDGKPLGIDHISTSQEWITAEFDAAYDPTGGSPFDANQKHVESMGRVIVTVHRPPADAPTFFNEKVELWNGQQSDHSAKIIELHGQIQGEITADPPRMEWAFADLGDDITKYSDQALTRHILLISALGKPVEFKKISTDVQGLNVKVVPKGGKNFDMVIKFEKLPHNLIDGKVTLETTLESMPKLEIPLHIMAP